MYIPQDFAVDDRKKILEFIKSNAFGQLISTVDGRLFSSHIPFCCDNQGQSLICHMAKNNPQWKEIVGQEVLLTFQGPHDYISPSWYAAPGVPTWNYQVAHVYGRAELITEASKLKRIINELTKLYESSSETPWSLDYNESMLNAIIGIEIKITEIQCKYKLSQNRSEQDRKQVIKQLRERGSGKLAKAMETDSTGPNVA